MHELEIGAEVEFAVDADILRGQVFRSRVVEADGPTILIAQPTFGHLKAPIRPGADIELELVDVAGPHRFRANITGAGERNGVRVLSVASVTLTPGHGARSAPRHLHRLPVWCLSGVGDKRRQDVAHTRDLSMRGAGLLVAHPFQGGEVVDLVFDLMTDVALLNAVVRRCGMLAMTSPREYILGVEFTDAGAAASKLGDWLEASG